MRNIKKAILVPVTLAIWIYGLLSPATVYAHAILVKSIPAKDETVKVSPKQIEVWFNEGVGSEYKALAVIDATGKRVDNHDVEQGLTDRSYLHSSIPELESGKYTVRYRVVSKDFHIVTGKYQFEVKK